MVELLEIIGKLTARVDALEAENQRLQQENEALRSENERLKKRIDELERKSKKYVAPYSREEPKVDPQPPGRHAGQGRFVSKQRPTREQVTRVVDVKLQNRCACGGELRPFKTDFAFITALPAAPPQVTEYHLEVGRCEVCGRDVRASHPEVAADQRGASAHRLSAEVYCLAHSLHYDLGIPVRKVPEVLRLTTGLSVSQSALTRDALRVTRAGHVLQQGYQQLRDDVQQQPSVHQDDTGWRVHGQSAWLQVFKTPQSVVYQIRTRHTHAQLQELVPATYQGTLCCDRFSTYDHGSLADVKQQKCLHHVIGSCKQALNVQLQQAGRGRAYPRKLLVDFQAALGLHQRFHLGYCTLSEYQRLGRELTAQIETRLDQSCRSKENLRLQKGLVKHHQRGNLLRFLADPLIEPTNNAAERALRPAVIARKVSQCSKTTAGSEAFAIFKSLTQTARLRGLDPFQILLDHRINQNTR
ncbi:IS66 family transposase (plasmid) [Deinococcus radiomollis]|uniref:IS66 family transposase n=1 Tax=Deinococcus radiomollis TaxID=468916 RepID=UPI00389195A1